MIPQCAGAATLLSAPDLGFTRPRMGVAVGADGAPMVLVPAGEILMGSAPSDGLAEADERPRHRVTLPAFHLDKCEVSNGQYRAFLKAVGKGGHASCERSEPPGKDHTPNTATWNDAEWSAARLPVVNVDWYDAAAYSAWAGKRLPSDAEWEKAARGVEGRIYPWSDIWGRSRANSSESGRRYTVEVGSLPAGASPYGAGEMAGNVWEWERESHDERGDAGGPRENTPGPSNGSSRVLRGGSWASLPGFLRSASRGRVDPSNRINYFGFRCVQDQE